MIGRWLFLQKTGYPLFAMGFQYDFCLDNLIAPPFLETPQPRLDDPGN